MRIFISGDNDLTVPPFFSISSMSPMTIDLSTAFTMSYSVSAATDTAVSASISTPVCPEILTRASIA